MFTGIDFIICILFVSGFLLALARGAIGTLIDFTGITAGILLASVTYLAPVNLFRRFEITGYVVNLIFFLLCFLFFTMTIILLFEMLRKKVSTEHVLDKIFGAVLGVAEGLLFASVVLIIISSSFNAASEIQHSTTTKYVLRFLPAAYEKIERIDITVPKLLLLPSTQQEEFNPSQKSIQFVNTNLGEKLDGATCLKCGGKVIFEGYYPKIGALLVPKYVCTKCGRTSDGCQTYEGYHLLYKKCPITLAREKHWFDCGSWLNYEWIMPKGPCPVDNNKLESWKWRKPIPYPQKSGGI